MTNGRDKANRAFVTKTIRAFDMKKSRNCKNPFALLIKCVFSPFSIAITSLGEERADFTAFSTLVRFALVWVCLFPLTLGVWLGLQLVIATIPGLFFFSFFCIFVNRR